MNMQIRIMVLTVALVTLLYMLKQLAILHGHTNNIRSDEVKPLDRKLEDTPRTMVQESPIIRSASTGSMLVGVFINAHRFENERSIRDAYRHSVADYPLIRLSFFVGREASVNEENAKYSDIVQGQFSENVNNGKTFEWLMHASENNAQYVIKVDQDTAVLWASLLSLPLQSPMYFGTRVLEWGLVPEISPVADSPGPPSNDCKDLAGYCWFYMSGGFYGLSMDVVKTIVACPFAREHRVGIEDALTGLWVRMCFPDVRILDLPFGLVHHHYYYDKSGMPDRIREQRLLPVLPPSAEGMVSVNLVGGLGNQLFQTASSFGIALARGAAWCVLGRGDQLRVNFLVEPTPCVSEGVTRLDENGGFLKYQHATMIRGGGSRVHVGTYLQSYRYFASSGIPFELRAKGFGLSWVASHGVNAGIHVRRTDQLTDAHGGKDPGVEYFELALQRLRMRDTIANVVVCTDDPDWVEAQPIFQGMLVRRGGEPDEDMAILAACKHLIISIGTFGWWAAYLRGVTGGETIYFAEPFHRPLDYSEHFMSYWTPIMGGDVYERHLTNVLRGCGDVCNLSLTGTPSLFFDYIDKRWDCMALGTNAHIDAAGWEQTPPREIPAVMRDAFLFHGRVAIEPLYFANNYLHKNAFQPVWTSEHVEDWIHRARSGELDGNYGREETRWVTKGLEQMDLVGASVLVIGSEIPWIEACVLASGASNVTTLEYGRIRSEHPQIRTLTPDEMRTRFAELSGTFDAVVTFSSVEHSGLGRYGDALNPYGDKQALARAWCLSKPGARLLIGVMTGNTDRLVFNAHRVYGPLQFAHLLAGWQQLWRAEGGEQVVYVLRKPL